MVDFGGQYSQLIARRVREARVYSELVSHRATVDEIRRRNPVALILSGGPASVYAEGAPKMDTRIFALGIPTLGICYGAQLLALDLGGRVDQTGAGEYGKVGMRTTEGTLFATLPEDQTAWMSHRDTVVEPPVGRADRRDVRAHAGRGVRGRRAEALRRSVPSRGRAHSARTGGPQELPLRRGGGCAVLDARGRDRGAGRADPRRGGERACSLRALRRCRLGGRGAARPQGSGRPAHVCVRRPRPAAKGRGRAGGRDVRRPVPRAARARAGAGALRLQARRRHRPGEASG